MPKPKTKTELLDAAEAQYAKLDSLIEGMSSDDQHTHFDPSITQIGKEAHWARDKNLRDVLAHLHEWQSMLLGFVDANLHGQPRPFLPFPHTWRTTPTLNQEIWTQYQGTELEAIRENLADSHTAVVVLIGKFTNEELFIKAYFPWTAQPRSAPTSCQPHQATTNGQSKSSAHSPESRQNNPITGSSQCRVGSEAAGLE